jgi:hydrogenase 3 maturation protease
MNATVANLADFLQGRICVFGFGNRMWGDDGVGSHLAELLQDTPGIAVVDGGFVPENHLEAVARTDPDTILLVDATDFGGVPGECRLLQGRDLAMCGVSTHAGSPRMLSLYLANRTGARIGLLAIQPANSQEGPDLSPAVQAAVNYLARVLKGD